MTNTNIKTYATELAQILSDIEDRRVEAKSILEAAKDAGINTRALSKLAKEMNTDSDKLRKKYDDEEQLDMFRAETGLFRMKGLDTTEKASAAFRMVGDRGLQEAAKALDAVAGTSIAKTHKQGMAAVRAMQARDAAKEDAE